MTGGSVAAVDLGATNGRVVIGRVSPEAVSLESVARFPNTPVRVADGLHWNILEIYRRTLAGLAGAARIEPGIASIGVDSWAVDYGLLRGDRLIGLPYHYRDERTRRGVERVHATMPFRRLYAENGLQFLSFNTLYQLAAEDPDGVLSLADCALLIPDLIGFWLTGARIAEATNASTTGLVSMPGAAARGARPPEWDAALISRIGLPLRIFPPIALPGSVIGTLRPHVAHETGLPESTPLIAVGSHDTASAVVAVPMTRPDAAYVSCGTWGLVGVELEHPVLTAESRTANFTNEAGVDGRVRFLHNVMGLWILSQCLRTWAREDDPTRLTALLAAAADVPQPSFVFDVDDPRFLAPGDMPARITRWCVEHDRPGPRSPAEFVRLIVESLAQAFADAVVAAGVLSGREVRVIHLVGGGSQNALLCQATADRSGLPVLAGPVEATSLGNVLVQARASGFVTGDLESLRALVARSFVPVRFEPRRLADSERTSVASLGRR